MFFIRTTLLLGLGVLILPTDRESQAHVYGNAKSALVWTATFCDRNPATCVQGRQAWGVFVQKAEFGVKMAVDLIADHNKAKVEPAKVDAVKVASGPLPAVTHAASAVQPARRASAAGASQPSDLEPTWRGKSAKVGG